MEYLEEDAKKKKMLHMPDDHFRHLKAFIINPQYVNSPHVSDVMRAWLVRHTRIHRYAIMQRDAMAGDGSADSNGKVAALVEQATTKLQKKRNLYTSSEPLQVVRWSDIEKTIRYVHVDKLNHAGQDATWRHLSSKYTNIRREWCREYCIRCRVCAVRTRRFHKAPLQPIVTQHILNKIVVDTIDLSESAVDEYRYVFYAVDHYSKFHWAIVTKTKAASNALLLFKSIFQAFGPSKFVQSDNGKEFRNHSFQSFLLAWNSKLIFSRVRHPQTNGAIERANGHLKTQIFKWREEHAGTDNDWPNAVDKIVHVINCTRHVTTKQVPYQLLFNRRSLYFSHHLEPLNHDPSASPIADPNNTEVDNGDEVSDTGEAVEDEISCGDNDMKDNNNSRVDIDNNNNDINEVGDINDDNDSRGNEDINDINDDNVRGDGIEPAYIDHVEEANPVIQRDEHINDLNIGHFGELGYRCHNLLNINDIGFLRWGCGGRGLCSICALYTAFTNTPISLPQARILRLQMRDDVISLGEAWYNQCCPAGSLSYQSFVEQLDTHNESMGMEFFYVASRMLCVNIYVVRVMIEMTDDLVPGADMIRRFSVSVIVELADKSQQRTYDRTIAIYHRHQTTIVRPQTNAPVHSEGGHYEALVLRPRTSKSPWPTAHPATEQLERARRETAAHAATVHAAAKMKARYDRGRKVKIFPLGGIVTVAVPVKLRKKSNAALNFSAVIVRVQPVANGRDRVYTVMTVDGVVANKFSAEDLLEQRAASYPELSSLNIEDFESQPVISIQDAYRNANARTNITNVPAPSAIRSYDQRVATTSDDNSSATSSSSSSDDYSDTSSESDDEMLTPETTQPNHSALTTPSTGTSALSSSSAASVIRPLYIIKANKPSSKQRRYQVAWGVDPSQPSIVMSKTWETANWFGAYADRLSLLNAFKLPDEAPE